MNEEYLLFYFRVFSKCVFTLIHRSWISLTPEQKKMLLEFICNEIMDNEIKGIIRLRIIRLKIYREYV